MSSQEVSGVLARKFFASLLVISLVSPATPALASGAYVSSPVPDLAARGRLIGPASTAVKTIGRFPVRSRMALVASFTRGPAAQAATAGVTPGTTGQQITLAENGNPIAAADVALVLANMNKVSLGKTDDQGKTNPALDLANAAPGNAALDMANLGKVPLHAEVDECADGKRQVYLVGPGGKLPPLPDKCKRRSLAGTFFWGQSAEVILDLMRGTLETKGLPSAARRPVALAPKPAAQPQKPAETILPPGAVPLADEATRSLNKALDDFFGRQADQITGDEDPAGIRRGRVDKQALVLLQNIYMRDLTNYSKWIADMAGGTDAQIDDLVAKLQKDAEGVYDAYSRMQWASSGFNPLDAEHSAGAEKTRYDALLRDANSEEAHGNPQRAAMLRQFAKDSPWGQFLPFRQRFYEALDKNPLLGIQIKGYFTNGDYLFSVLRHFRTDRYDTRAELRAALRDVVRLHLQAFREQTDAERNRISQMATLKALWELAGPRYSRQQEKAAQMGPFAQGLMNALQGEQAGFEASNTVDEGWKNFWLSVVVAGTALIPVVGPFASAGIQLYHDGSDLVIAYLDNANVENASGVLGYVQRIDSEEKLSDAKFRTLVAAAMFLPTVPGALDGLKKAGIKIVHRASAATKASTEVEAAAAASKIGTEVPKGVPETPGWAPGRQPPISEQDAAKMLKDFIARQDKIGGVQEVEAEIALARKAGVPEEKITELTANFKPEGSPLNNKVIATDLMKARLQSLGYDLNMTQEEFNALQGMSVRSGPKGAGLTQKDIDFLREKLAADPKYFEKLPQRGYATDFSRDPFHGRLQPQEGFIAGLDAESAAALQKTFRRWNTSTETSPLLKSFEDAVRNKVPAADLKAEVMALKADPQAMRSLKNAPNEVKEAFNEAEALVYQEHDQAVLNYVKKIGRDKQGNPTPWSQEGVEIKVDDFRTPGSSGTGVNTDRDYRILYKDPQKGWIEVPKEFWQDFSTQQFAKASGYTPEKLMQIAAPEDVAAWKTWDPAKHHGETVEQAMTEKWKELHQQLGTDKFHPEASVEFSDQGFLNGQRAQVANNIKAVKNGDALLQDAEGFGMMYNEKADAYLRMKSALHPGGDQLEAMAQLNKGIDMLNDVRAGYAKFFQKAGAPPPFPPLPKNFQEAADAIQSLAPFDKTITADKIAAVEQKLRDLGFAGPVKQGDAFRGFVKALDGQFEAFKTVQAPKAMSAAAGAAKATEAAAGTGARLGAPATGAGLSVQGLGPAGQSGMQAANTAGNAPNPCKFGTKKLNLDQFNRMRRLLLMQEQGVTPHNPSEYSDLPPIEELTETEHELLAMEMDQGASEARDLDNQATAKVYDSLSRKLRCQPPQTNTAIGGGKVPANQPAGANAIGGAALGKDIRPGDYTMMGGIVRDYVKGQGLNPDGWKPTQNPGGSVTYTSPDGKTSLTADFKNGQIVIQPAGANALGGGQPPGGGAAVGGGGAKTPVPGPVAGTPQAPCPEAEESCQAEQDALNAAADAYEQARAALDAAVEKVGQTGAELSAAGAAMEAAQKAGGAPLAAAQARLQKAKQEDDQAVAAQQQASEKASAAEQAGRDAQAKLEACEQKAKEKCDQRTAANVPPQQQGGNVIGRGATGGKQQGESVGGNPGGQQAGGNVVGGGTAGGTTGTGPGATGGGTVVGGGTPAPAHACKNSDDDCAELGRIATQKQLEALQAQDDLKQVPFWQSQADDLQKTANSYHDQATHEFELSAGYANLKDKVSEASYKKQAQDDQAKGDQAMAQAQALRDKAAATPAKAAAAEKAAQDARNAYNACLRLPPCPEKSNATATGGNTVGGGATPAPPPVDSACTPMAGGVCTSPSDCVTSSSCKNVMDFCKLGNAICTSGSGESPYQVMMTAAPVTTKKSGRLVFPVPGRSRFTPATYHVTREDFLMLAALGISPEGPAPSDADAKNVEISLVSNGNSSGEAFQLQMRDSSGRVKNVALPEGVVLQPVKPGSEQPAAARGTSGLLTQQIGAFCMQYLKLPPELGMIYKIAPPSVQEKYSPMRLVLQAGRTLAEKGKLHPDSDPDNYANSIRQYAVWAQQEGWDEQKFADQFVDRTRKNAELKKVKWSQQIENALRGAVPGRWRDITQVLDLAHAWQKSPAPTAPAN